MQVGVVRKSSFGRLFFDFASVGFASTPLFIALAGGLKYDEDYVSAALMGVGCASYLGPIGGILGAIAGIDKRINFSKLSRAEKEIMIRALLGNP